MSSSADPGKNKFLNLTLNPCGLPHEPQPGVTEASIGKKETIELAVMVDSFNPLTVTLETVHIEKMD